MKKILKVLFLAMALIFLCACSKKDAEESSEQISEKDWNVYIYSKTDIGSQSQSNVYSVSSEKELEDLLKNAGFEMQIPSYVPDGYQFESASLSYYITKEILEQSEVTENETKDGQITYEYILPQEVLAQVDGFWITYRDQDGNMLEIQVEYVENMALDTGNLDFQELKVENFDLAREGVWEKQYLGEFFRETEPIYEYDGDSERKMNCIFVRISMTDMENEQIAEIAESM